MASRIIAQMIVQGSTMLARAFITAYQQALQNAKAGGAATAAHRVAKRVMHKQEALMILNIEEPALTKSVLDDIYKRQFDKNDPKNGGSFYLQSKLFRAHQSLEVALKNKENGVKDDDSGAANASSSAANDPNAAEKPAEKG